MSDLPQPWALRHQAPQFLFRRIAGTVVDINDLEGAAGQRRGDLGDEWGDIAGFVPYRHDHRYGRAGVIPLQHGACF
jgi:hypothetical protein